MWITGAALSQIWKTLNTVRVNTPSLKGLQSLFRGHAKYIHLLLHVSFCQSSDYLFLMSSDLYSGRVLELAASIPNTGRLADANGSSTKIARLCGSEVTVDVKMLGDDVIAFAITPKACALGQASASVLARNIIGSNKTTIQRAYDQFKAMLKQNGPPPDGVFWELRYLAGVADYPPRHASTLLAFEAALAAIDQAKAHADRFNEQQFPLASNEETPNM